MKGIALLITAVAVLAFSGTAHAAQTTYIGCSAGEDPKPRVAPKSCSTWYPWVDHAHSHNFQRLRWHSWGGAQATATGVDVYVGMGNVVRTPVRLTVSRPRGFETYAGGVDMPAYTRMSVRYRDGFVAKVRLAWGFDLWPDY
jgi:hypothetical protein